MKDYIKNKLRNDLTGANLNESSIDKWSALEDDVTNALKPLIEKHKGNFGHDSYAVIDAIQQVFDGMFQKVKR